MTVEVDERPRPGEPPPEYVRRLAMEKSQQADLKIRTTTAGMTGVVQGFSPALEAVRILAADTAVVIDEAILGKPIDDRDADRMLQRLSGRTHEVLTGVSLRGSGREVGCVISTAVCFHALSDADRAWYVGSGEGRDKAGGYAIQGLASRFVPHIEGSYTNVVGLPIAAVAELLRQEKTSMTHGRQR